MTPLDRSYSVRMAFSFGLVNSAELLPEETEALLHSDLPPSEYSNILLGWVVIYIMVTGLLATLVLPKKLALAALCGSFAGMAKTAVIPGVGAGLLLGAICAGIVALFDKKKWLIKVGGRLGFCEKAKMNSVSNALDYKMKP
jgi:hypothetical protein